MSDYDIQSMTGREHVRRRPGMYFGGTDKNALHHLVCEVLHNSINAVLIDQCTHIWLTLRQNNVVSIEDNSQGISVQIGPSGRSDLELVMTKVLIGRWRGDYEVTGGLHGLGLSARGYLYPRC